MMNFVGFGFHGETSVDEQFGITSYNLIFKLQGSVWQGASCKEFLFENWMIGSFPDDAGCSTAVFKRNFIVVTKRVGNLVGEV